VLHFPTLSAVLIQDRGQVRARGFVVESRRHQRHWLNDPQPVLKAPVEQRGVAGWHEYSRTLKLRGCRDQRLQVLVALPNRVTEEGYGRLRRRVGFGSAVYIRRIIT
jgi:hypothetical protein